MKITKRDKVLLISLLVILVVGIFLMYGIIPAYQDLKKQEESLSALQNEVEKLKLTYNRNNPVTYQNKIENSLMNYYKKESDVLMVSEDVDAFIDYETAIRDVVKDLNLVFGNKISYSLGNDITSVVKSEDVAFPLADNKKNSVRLFIASTVLSFTFTNIDDVKTLLDEINNNEQMSFINLKIIINEKGEYVGQVSAEKIYLKTTNFIPKPVVNDGETFNIQTCNDAPEVPTYDAESNTITFNAMQNAKYYEIYEVTKTDKEDGTSEIRYSLRTSNIVGEADKTVITYDVSRLAKGKRYVVTAVGNYKTAKEGDTLYYRTILSDYLYNKGFEL